MPTLKELNNKTQDDLHNPAMQLSKREKDAFGGIAKNYRTETANPDQENRHIAAAAEREKNAINYTGSGAKPNKKHGKMSRTKKRVIGAVISALIGGGAFASFFSIALAPISFVQNMMRDLNTQVGAMDSRAAQSVYKPVRLTEAEKRAAIKRGFFTQREKFKTIGKTQVGKLAYNGIEVVGDTFLGRTTPTGYKYQGRTMNPSEFAKALQNNTDNIRLSYKTALNMSYLGVNDKTVVNRVLKKFGISRQPPELKGNHESRVSTLMNRVDTISIDDLTFESIPNDDGTPSGKFTLTGDTATAIFTAADIASDPGKYTPILNEEGKPTGKYTLKGDNASIYTDSQVKKMTASIDTVKATANKPPSVAGEVALKGISVLGFYDLACSVKNKIGAASVAAKIAAKRQLIQYSARILPSVYAFNLQRASMEDARVVSEFFMSPDTRKEIVDLTQSVTEGSDGSPKIDASKVPMVPNPDYGKTAMDSSLYGLSALGTVPQKSASSVNKPYSLGFGSKSVLSNVKLTADGLNFITNLGTDNKICNVVQNWFVRGVGVAVAVVGAIGSSGGSLLLQGAIMGAFIGAFYLLDYSLQSALGGSVIPDNMDELPADRAAALWTGTAALTGEAAQARGLIPGTEESIIAYQSLQNQSTADYIAIEQKNAQPFDITNPNSFVGTMAGSLRQFMPSTISVASFIGSIPSVVFGSFSTLLAPQHALAQTVSTERFKQCDDDAYKSLDIAADVQCNVRYVMPKADLDLEIDSVAQYMEDNGYVEKDTTNGLPSGYIPPDPAESDNFAMNILKGIKSTFISDRAGMLTNDYAKFLDYCAYRSMPYGETFEESGAFGSAGNDWISGKNCMKEGAPYSYFRIYTLDKTVQEAVDGEE